jgi:hypothetical protein
MEERKYVIRLINLGYSIQEAEYTVFDFIKNFGLRALQKFVESMESDANVDKRKYKSHFCTCG